MKALGIFNLCALLLLGLLVVALFSTPGGEAGAGDALTLICLGVFGGAALVVIDLIWLIVLAFKRVRHCPELAGQDTVGNPVDVNLVRYLKKARAEGLGDEEVERRLLRHGWNASEIQRAGEVLKF